MRSVPRVVVGERRLRAAAQDVVLIRGGARRQHRVDRQRLLLIQAVDGGAVRDLQLVLPLGKVRGVLDLDRLVVLGEDVQGPRLEAEVDVLGDQDHLVVRSCRAGEAQDRVEDAVVRLAGAEDLAGVDAAVLVGQHAEAAVRRAVERDPLLEHVVVRGLVELADELARLEVEDRVPLLESVELLEHRDQDRDVVLLEVVERVEVVEDDRGVENEDLALRFRHGKDKANAAGRWGARRSCWGGRCREQAWELCAGGGDQGRKDFRDGRDSKDFFFVVPDVPGVPPVPGSAGRCRFLG